MQSPNHVLSSSELREMLGADVMPPLPAAVCADGGLLRCAGLRSPGGCQRQAGEPNALNAIPVASPWVLNTTGSASACMPSACNSGPP